MPIVTYNEDARRRINRVVKKVERWNQPPWPMRDRNFSGSDGHMGRLVIAEADIEHGAFGTSHVAEAVAYDSTGYTGKTDRPIEVYNLRDKIWEGATMVTTPVALAGVDGGLKWVCFMAWSATRIRGFAVSEITHGTTGSLSSVVALNGHYSPGGNVSVYLPTSVQDVEAGMPTWAELVYDPNTGQSRWEVCASDCAGGA